MENFGKKPVHFSEHKTSSTHLANLTNLTLTTNKFDPKKSNKNLFKTPNKTQLQLSAKKKPHTHNAKVINDRYIPNRISSNQMEVSYHLMHSNSNNNLANIKQHDSNNDNSTTASNNNDNDNLSDELKRRLLIDTCNGIPEKTKILNLHNKQSDSSEQSYPESLKMLYSSSLVNSAKKNVTRVIPSTPDRILDAPEFRDDYYLNLIDWSVTNNLAVALNKDMYIWNANSGEISMLFGMEEEDNHYISSTGWINNSDDFLAVGNSKNNVEIWDINRQTRIREMKPQTPIGRVGCISWSHNLLSNGSRSGLIHHHDVRIKDHHVGTLKLHDEQVCGLKWSSDGRHLASGANDNLVAIWDSRITHDAQPLHVLREHTAAVKAVSWCPWQNNILATGGGTADGHIKIWNVYNGSMLQSQDAKSQISCILWSTHYKELISSHGFQQNQLSIWKYPEMTKVSDLTGHSNRVLMMAMSPDEEMIASAGADETLRLWKCFAVDKRAKESVGLGEKKSSFTGLSRCIR